MPNCGWLVKPRLILGDLAVIVCPALFSSTAHGLRLNTAPAIVVNIGFAVLQLKNDPTTTSLMTSATFPGEWSVPIQGLSALSHSVFMCFQTLRAF